MLKELFRFSSQERVAPESETHLNGSSEHTRALARLAEEFDRSDALSAFPVSGAGSSAGEKPVAFEQIYQNAAVKPARLAYSILKVSDMLNSPHLSAMSADARRCSLLMALDAAGAEVEDLLQDAVVRQRALNDYEDAQQNRLKDLEATKAEDNREIQAELERLTSQYMTLIQANLDELAHEQDQFRAWQRRKQQEVQRITEAAAICVPPGAAGNPGGLAAVLERASGLRK